MKRAKVRLTNYTALRQDDEEDDDGEDPGSQHIDLHDVPPPEPEPDGPPAPLDIWQTVFYGLSFTSAVSAVCTTLINEFELDKPGMVLLALFSVYLPCFFQYLLQVCVLALPKTHEPLREVVPYLWELLNVALMCMAAANAPSCTKAFLLADAEQDVSQCAAFSYLMFVLRFLTFLAYVLYRWTHNLSKHEQFSPSIPSKANSAYLLSRGVVILLTGLFWLMNGMLQHFEVYDKADFVGTWWALLVVDIALVHLGFVPSFTAKVFGHSRLFDITNLLGAFNLFFGSVLASYVIAATLFADNVKSVTHYLISLLIICIAFFLAPTYNANFLKGWFRHHKKNRCAKILVGSVWALSHILLFVSVIGSGSFYMIAINRDLNTQERWWMCAAFTAAITSLSVIGSADVISMFTYSAHMLRIAKHHPTRVAYMGKPLQLFMIPDEVASLRPSQFSSWLAFTLSLLLRLTWGVIILLFPLLPTDIFPIWALFLGITIMTLLYSLSGPIYIVYLISLCRRNVSSKLQLKWLYAIRHEKLMIVHRHAASALGLPEPASATDSDSD